MGIVDCQKEDQPDAQDGVVVVSRTESRNSGRRARGESVEHNLASFERHSF